MALGKFPPVPKCAARPHCEVPDSRHCALGASAPRKVAPRHVRIGKAATAKLPSGPVAVGRFPAMWERSHCAPSHCASTESESSEVPTFPVRLSAARDALSRKRREWERAEWAPASKKGSAVVRTRAPISQVSSLKPPNHSRTCKPLSPEGPGSVPGARVPTSACGRPHPRPRCLDVENMSNLKCLS